MRHPVHTLPAENAHRATARPAQTALIRELSHVALLHEERRGNPRLAQALEQLGAWQALRLSRTYADLEAQPRYAEAIEFFESDLYGGADFSRRDADLARVVPVLVRTLPDAVIGTIAHAMELNALSQELDRALLARLPEPGAELTVAAWCRAYRLMDNRAGRERQIRLIADIGAALDRYVRKPLLRTALLMMRQPAKLAGMLVLHDFLERGFLAFRRMDGADEFLATIVKRETQLMEAIFGGANAPFADPQSMVES